MLVGSWREVLEGEDVGCFSVAGRAVVGEGFGVIIAGRGLDGMWVAMMDCDVDEMKLRGWAVVEIECSLTTNRAPTEV